MNQNIRFQINQPFVVSEIIEGEVVIMNLDSGNYYSTQHIGAQVWQWLGEGMSEAEIITQILLSYTGDINDVSSGVSDFIQHLLTENLIRPKAESLAKFEVAAKTPQVVSLSEEVCFTAPLLEVYSDMKDLLLLDPIHDVTEEGWPTATPTRAL
jgi:Coenzyme PQQ synthesis protein D (PqqD)